MKLKIITLLFVIVCGSGFAQKSESVKIDSLKKELRNASNDSLRANLIFETINFLSHFALDAMNRGQFAEAYEAYRTILENLEDQENQRLFKSFGESSEFYRGFWETLTNNTFNYGILMHVTGNRDDAMAYYRKANSFARQRFDTLNQAYTEANIAFLFLREHELDSAQLYMDRVFKMPFSNQRYYFYLFYIGGDVRLKAGQFELARELFLKGMDNTLKYNITPEIGLAINYLGLSKAYQQLNNRDSSHFYGIKSMALFQKIREIHGVKLDLASAYENMFEHFQQFGHQDSAYVYLDLASKTRNAFTKKTISNLAAFQKMLLKNQLLLKDLQREKIEAQGKTRMYILLSALSVFIVLGAVLFYGFFQKKKANELLALQKEEILSTLSKLKATQAQLIQSEKMASLGELTAGIAHEIQNPLNFVNNFSELNKELVAELNGEIDNGNKEDAKAIANDIKINSEKINLHGERASSIVKGMLEHSRKSSGEKTWTDINALCDEYLRLSYHGLRAKDKTFNADYKTDLDPNLPKINVVSQDIARVLLNLINNAFQACAERSLSTSNEKQQILNKKNETLKSNGASDQELGAPNSTQGELGVRGNIAGYSPLVRISTKSLGEKIEITIADNGPGIPDSIKDKIFQPFFTTKPTGQGTGLGLSLAYDIIKAHGGSIEVKTHYCLPGGVPIANGMKGESKVGEGTEFIIQLP